MVVLPLSKLPMDVGAAPNVPVTSNDEQTNWLQMASGATLLAGGVLFLFGKPRLALAAAAAGTTLALIDQQEEVRKMWNQLPGYIADVQHVLTQVQETVDEVSVQREKLERVFARARQKA